MRRAVDGREAEELRVVVPPAVGGREVVDWRDVVLIAVGGRVVTREVEDADSASRKVKCARDVELPVDAIVLRRVVAALLTAGVAASRPRRCVSESVERRVPRCTTPAVRAVTGVLFAFVNGAAAVAMADCLVVGSRVVEAAANKPRLSSAAGPPSAHVVAVTTLGSSTMCCTARSLDADEILVGRSDSGGSIGRSNTAGRAVLGRTGTAQRGTNAGPLVALDRDGGGGGECVDTTRAEAGRADMGLAGREGIRAPARAEVGRVKSSCRGGTGRVR